MVPIGIKGDLGGSFMRLNFLTTKETKVGTHKPYKSLSEAEIACIERSRNEC